MTEDKLDQIIRDAARDYNRPPEIVPREDMWARIQEAQRATAAAPALRVERGVGAPSASFVSRTQRWSLAAAAGILLVAGNGIVRMTRSGPAPTVAATSKATSPASVPSVDEPVQNTVASSPSEEQPSDVGRTVGNGVRLASVPSRNTRAEKPARTTLEIDATRMNATYQLASMRHLAETEALLTAFSTDSANRVMDPVVAKWSRDLLANTRLLLDSPAARDPLRKHLLEDLELVLTQIVQLSAAPNANERDMVESTIREGHVLTRLRTAIPAGRPQGS
jgi:hypothetical protein